MGGGMRRHTTAASRLHPEKGKQERQKMAGGGDKAGGGMRRHTTDAPHLHPEKGSDVRTHLGRCVALRE